MTILSSNRVNWYRDHSCSVYFQLVGGFFKLAAFGFPIFCSEGKGEVSGFSNSVYAMLNWGPKTLVLRVIAVHIFIPGRLFFNLQFVLNCNTEGLQQSKRNLFWEDSLVVKPAN